MSKDLSKYQQGIVNRYYEHQDTIRSNKLSELVSEIWLAEDEKTKTKLWGKAQETLMRMGVNATQVAKVVGKRDMEALAKLVAQADAGTAPKSTAPTPQQQPAAPSRVPNHNDTRTVKQMQAEKATQGGYDSLDEENLKRAMRAFRKKLKVTKLDDESRLGNRYVTAGRTSGIAAITPPHEYPASVWNKLVELGRLKHAGQGTYQLP